MKRFLPIIFIFIISMVISWPLLAPGLHQIHDDQQVARLYLFDGALKAGQFPVRIVDNLGFGFGYPLFNFYPPFVYGLGEIFHLIGFGFVNSIKLVMFTSFFASGIAMYLFVLKVFGRVPAMAASTLYLLAPYRALDIYVRGALAESFTFVWLPLILLSFYLLAQKASIKRAVVCALPVSLLMITHNLILMPFMLLLPFYLVFLLYVSAARRRFIFFSVAALFLSFGLTAFFWVPSLMEKKFTIVDSLLLVNLASYKIHFVYPLQLWNWAWGFGGSAEGIADGISFKLGKLHILTSLAAICLSFFHIFGAGWKKKHKVHVMVFGFTLLLFLSLFMSLAYSDFVWSVASPLQYLQFPWRFLTFGILFLSILGGALIYLVRLPVLQFGISVLILASLLLTNIKLFKPALYRPQFDDKFAVDWTRIAWDVSGTSFEYMPAGISLIKNDRGANVINISKEEIKKERVNVLSGDAQVKINESAAHKLSFDLNSKESSMIRINVANFPGWELLQNAEKLSFSDNNKFRLIEFVSPPGNWHYDLNFRDTMVRKFSNLISLLFVLIIVISAFPWKKYLKLKQYVTG